MQISDYISQYANSLAGTKTAAAKPSAQAADMAKGLLQLQAGTIFEGSINAIDGAKVLLGLANGQTLSARLEGNIQLLLGQSLFFQVKENDGKTVSIKPYTNMPSFNPTIQNALEAAGLALNEQTMGLVEHMMEQGMPIERHALSSMYQTLLQNPDVSLQTAVLMTKFGIPVNGQLAAQFENYQTDRHAMLTQMEQVMEQLPDVFAGAKDAAGLVELGGQVTALLTEHVKGEPVPALFTDNDSLPQPETVKDGQAAVQKTAPQTTVPQTAAQPQERTLAAVLTGRQLAELEGQLRDVFPQAAGKLKENLSPEQFLRAVADALHTDGEQPPSREALARLFTGREYHTLLKEVMENQWTVRPEELGDGQKVEELYARLDRQMGRLEQLAAQTGMDTGKLSQAAGEVRANIDFMNQINQAYTYVQIPLKLVNQNAHSDLYVYTNKKNLREREGELSAFLHLDLEHLGSTDVSVKMSGKNVTTKFYLADDGAYELLAAHLPQLEKRLEELGYSCMISMEHKEQKMDFVEDFLQKSQPATAAGKGALHRYSFDVRA